jgi:hypothetical protein
MARHLFFAITLMGISALFNSQAVAVTNALRCEDNASNCVGRCTNPGAGVYVNRCMSRCDQQVAICLKRAHDAPLSVIGGTGAK